jgi:hypothetical protein
MSIGPSDYRCNETRSTGGTDVQCTIRIEYTLGEHRIFGRGIMGHPENTWSR